MQVAKIKEVFITHIRQGVLLQTIKRSWIDIYHSIKTDADFMKERDDFQSQERRENWDKADV